MIKKKQLFFCIYNEEEIDKDLELETIADTINELINYLGVPKSTLYDLGIKKQEGLKKYIIIKNKRYLIIVDKDQEVMCMENYIKGLGIFVGEFTREDLKKGVAKLKVEEKKKETGLNYTNTKIVNGKLKIYVCNVYDFKI